MLLKDPSEPNAVSGVVPLFQVRVDCVLRKTEITYTGEMFLYRVLQFHSVCLHAHKYSNVISEYDSIPKLTQVM